MASTGDTGPWPKGPGVWFPPPLLFVAGGFLGWAMGRFVVHVPLLRAGVAGPVTIVALAFLVVGLVFGYWGVVTFLLARTAIIPHRPATRLVRHGPYRFTRNPMYLGITVAYAAAGVLMNSLWVLLLLAPVLLALWFLVIRREERYLRSAFGEEYAEYCRQVRRFI